MLRRCCAFLLLALLTSGALAQKQLLEIEIIGDGVAAPIDITDPAIIGVFSIWNGPSVVIHSQGARVPPTHLDPNVRDGRFIDWPRGVAAPPPPGLKRYQATFHISTHTAATRQYIVAYEFDAAAAQGYIYVPTWTTNDLISHGVEGNWMYAIRQWDEAIMPVIQSSSSGASRLEDNDRRCNVGVARMSEDGALTIQLIRDGRTMGKYRYAPSDQGYADMLWRVGTLAPGAQAEVSCWPRRG